MKRMLLVSACAAIILAAVSLVIAWVEMTTSSRGYCTRYAVNHTDREFARVALESYYGVLGDSTLSWQNMPAVEQAVSRFLTEHPACCTVYRERPEEVPELSRWFFKRHVVVKITYDRRQPDGSVESGPCAPSKLFVLVDNCFEGVEVIDELTPCG